ncbi:cytochrome-c oxidase, cbb3-type subunit III [Leucothrix pacifica]|uniref:Cbb3-type cytochrome c oxidase subunit n=1 Tax=Leucothrix pacifica TaxID=1247513 RepID=A0A317CDY4_9GAMM|nr:cytochrome-c oxidase, cbb3-type subunit III [Leucothrix pacifica]PWQ96587.1 cytochrome-c oxidase, cbb3-type subunit III [Leucothrix pacifica]
MTDGWSWYVIILVVGNIVGVAWLLFATSQSNGKDEESTTGHVWDETLQEYNNPLPKWWLWLFVITIGMAIIYLYWYPGLGNYKGALKWTQMSQFEEAREDMIDRQKVAFEKFADLELTDLAKNEKAMGTASRLFSNNCASCHGSAAQGAKGFPNLTDNDWLYGNSPEQIEHSIVKGRAGVMPKLGLSDVQIVQVSNYVLTLSGREAEADAEEAKKGEALFATCIACHGPDAKGMHALGAPNLTDDIWLHGSELADIQDVIREGRQGQMPAHENLLTKAETRLLTAYVMSLSK